jgi:hypothetical protein
MKSDIEKLSTYSNFDWKLIIVDLEDMKTWGCYWAHVDVTAQKIIKIKMFQAAALSRNETHISHTHT